MCTKRASTSSNMLIVHSFHYTNSRVSKSNWISTNDKVIDKLQFIGIFKSSKLISPGQVCSVSQRKQKMKPKRVEIDKNRMANWSH